MSSQAAQNVVALDYLRTFTYTANGDGFTATKALGVADAGNTVIMQWLGTFSGDSGGTTDARLAQFKITASGAINIAQMNALNIQTEVQHTANTVTFAYGSQGYIRLGLAGSTTGNVTTARWMEGHIANEGTGNFTTATVYHVGDVDLQDGVGLIGTLAGFRTGDLGHATRISTLTAGLYVGNMTGGAPTTAGIYSDMASGTNKWLLMSAGSAASAHLGKFKIGAVTSPATELDVLGTITVSAGITSGSTNNISMSSSGGEQVRVLHAASAVNFITLQGASTSNNPSIKVASTQDTNVDFVISTLGTGALRLFTNNGNQEQFKIAHTASANRFIQVTGSNGGNPSITTSAGNLAITPAIVGAATSGNALGGAATSSSTVLILPASSTSISSLRITHGSAPSSPVDGDIWTTTTGLFVRINGGTVGPLS